MATWWAWNYTTWLTNWLDPDSIPVRLMLIGVMLASLGMSVALPDAFGERGLMFAIAYVAIQVGRSAVMLAVLKPGDPLHQTFVRIVVWFVAASVFWLAGGLAHGTTRELLWLGALMIDYLAPACGFWTPGLGRSQTSDWTIHGGHLAERCQLLVIVALGESILVTGATTARLPLTAPVLTAFLISFVGSVAMWWIYFSRSAEAGSEVIAHAHDPGRLGRSAYTYFHLPMVAGIIVAAVGDELTIAHPDYLGEMGTTLIIVSGAALYLIGHTLYKWAVFEMMMPSRIVALVVLLVLIPLGLVLPNLLVSAAVTLLLGGLAAWEAWTYRRLDHTPVAAAGRGAI
jgi:low temperature requirement protein LtrA